MATFSRYLLSTYRSEDRVIIQCENVPQAEEALARVMAWLVSQEPEANPWDRMFDAWVKHQAGLPSDVPLWPNPDWPQDVAMVAHALAGSRVETPVAPSRVFDLTAELRRYFNSGTLDEASDLYLLLKEIEAMRPAPETKAPRVLSATERLNNLCDALSEQADESPFTREEWDEVDRQTVRLTNAVQGLIDAVRNVEIDKMSWDTSVAKPLETAYRALKHEDPVGAVKSGSEPT